MASISRSCGAVVVAWVVASAMAIAACGSPATSDGTKDAAAEAAPLVFTGCNGPAPAGYVPPKLPTYSGGACPTLTLTPAGTDAGYAPPENAIATTYDGGTANTRQFKLVTPSDLGPDEKVPVVFLWFWLGASAQDFIDRADVVTAAQQQRFIAVVPEKKGDVLFTWPFAATDSQDRMNEEFQFFDDMLACVAAQFPGNVNASCIASAGVSAGALFTDQLAPARSNVIASFLSLSGGVSGSMPSCDVNISCLKPWTKPSRNLPGMVLWGGSMDTCVVIDFQPASKNLEQDLDKEGSFYVECEHNCAHSQPPFDTPSGMTEYAAFWDFVYAHPYWLPAGESPYKAGGLPSTFPSWCSAKGMGTAVERTGVCGPSACSTTSTTPDDGGAD